MVDHLENGLQHADDGAIGAVFAFGKPAQAVEVAEEFVSAVDEVNDPRKSWPCSFIGGRPGGDQCSIPFRQALCFALTNPYPPSLRQRHGNSDTRQP